jgi:type IV secretion system protein VirB4
VRLTSFKLPSVKLQQKEIGVSRHLPFAYLDEHDIVRTKNGDYLVVLKVEGISWDTLEDHELNFEQTLRAKLFGMLADPRFAIYHTIIRSQVSTSLDLPHDVLLAKQLNAAYQQSLKTKSLFSNDLYITILLKGSGSKGNRITARMGQWFTKLSHGLSQKQAEMTHQDAIKALNEIALRFIAGLDKYKIRTLGIHKAERGIFSEQLQFFSRILNWDNEPLLAIDADIATYLPKRRLFFGAKGIESVGNLEDDARFATLLSLKEYPNSTYPGMLDYLLQLPIEMVITQSFAFQHRQQTREALELQLRRLRQSRDPDEKGEAQLREALGGVVSGEFGFGFHHLTTMVLADDLKTLEQNIAAVTKRFAECGIVAIRERLNLEACFWAQFPGNFRYIVRKLPITTDNFAALCSLNNDPIGQKSGNHWGEAVTLLKTPSNLPYFFNFHRPHSDVGHTLILGTTGSGKTLLTCFLLSATLKYGTRIFYFDKDYGAEAFMRGLGADYSVLGNGTISGLNPLQLPDTRRNRHFLVEWLSSLLRAFGETLTSEDTEIVHQAVRLNYEKLMPEQRTLQNLAAAFGAGGPGTLRNRIDQWHGDQHLNEFFGAKKDTLRLDNRFFCFEMGHLLEKANAVALPSVLLYLFHRIQILLDDSHNTPTIICLDEAWALLGNAIFGENIKNWLKTFRKRNAMVLLLSQELGDITNAAISDSINAETATKIFFPDASPLKEVYRDVFHLSEREINLLKDYSTEKSRFFLIKQTSGSSFATLDLSGMEQWIPLLSGNSDTVRLLHHLIQKHGSEPEKWLPIYLRQAGEIKKR